MAERFPACVAAVLLLACGCQPAPPFLSQHDRIDLLIENGTVVDGVGTKAVAADVVIVNGKIARENGRLADGLFGRVLQPHADR